MQQNATKQRQSREGKSCGLDVKPEVAFRERQERKKTMKRIQIAIMAVGLAGAMSASASITYSGTGLSSLDYVGAAGDAQYVPASGLTPAYAALYTADASTAATADSPAVFVKAPVGTVLSTLSGSYTLSSVVGSGTSVQPYWALWVGTVSNPNEIAIYSLGGTPLTSSSTMHAFLASDWSSLGTWGDTLSQFDAITYGGVALGDMTVNWVGLEIGDGGSGPASANIESITVVPEPTTMIAGAMLLLPFGATTLRMLRKNRTA